MPKFTPDVILEDVKNLISYSITNQDVDNSKFKSLHKAIIKRYFEELTYDEIAEEMDLPLGTVKAQLFRAREFLANLMKKTKDSI
jgi:hypothetical protein